LAVDEWGAWFESEKNAPSQLYLESTLRDAVIAGLSLNIFNRHADRVRMANLAQMVNVIQSLILTDGPKMVVTPTYHVFDLYKAHQGATLIPTEVQAPDYIEGDTRLPGLSVSTSKNKAGRLHLTIVNLDPARASNVHVTLKGGTWRTARAQTITADRIDTRIRFDAPDPFIPRPLPARIAGGQVELTIAAKSVTLVEIGQ
ncbi:alpha-L-arabinofuranosidase C-terminal domain-containing protein, partial [Sphingobium sp.]|uniref:alpha-L-arabinofuranosidase C-terminal domain-containing protein n=1 Tax=Sphingobium sp. TaxID=1912891 RepID=UPI002BBB1CB1